MRIDEIDWKVLPHEEQRYETSGDWWWEGDTLHVRISRMSDWRYEFCCGLHEVVEAVLCRHMGISHETVDAFDMDYERVHQLYWTAPDLLSHPEAYPCGCPIQRLSDPGSDVHSPYRIPHLIAEAVESIAVRALRVEWDAYDQQTENPTP